MSSSEEYRVMLLEVASQIRVEELEGMKFLCVDFMPDCKREDTRGTLHFFRELEMQNKLGIDNLEWLIFMLKHLKRQDLVLKLTGFQVKRNLYLRRLCPHESTESVTPTQEIFDCLELDSTITHTGYSCTDCNCNESRTTSTKHHVSPLCSACDRQPGEFALKCMLSLATTGAWLGGSAFILNRYKDDPEALVTMVTRVVLPTGILVKYITSGSIKMLLWATDLYALNDLWKRYQAGQLKEDLEKLFVTEELRKHSNGEQIEFSVEINEQEYRNACLDLVIAHTQAEQSYHNSLLATRRRSRSVDNLTSLRLQEMTRDLDRPSSPDTRQIKDGFLSVKSCSISSRQTSLGSDASEDGSFHLLSDFLEFSDKSRDVCSLLDRKMVLCNDWRNLASEFGFKMIYVRLWDRNQSPSLTLLENVVSKDPATKLSQLIDKLSAIDRHDVVRIIQGREPNADPRTLWQLPFNIRKLLSFELDNAKEKQFHSVVCDILKDIELCKIESLRKSPSPTMALLEELETMCPCLPVSRVRDACHKGGVYGAVKIMDSHIRKKSFQGRIGSTRKWFAEHEESNDTKEFKISRDSAFDQDSSQDSS